MGLFRRRAEPDTTRYPGYPITGSEERRASHRRTGIRRAAREGQAWEDRDRAGDRAGGWYRTRR